MANNFPTIRPSLLMDYENSGVLDPRVTFTRAGQSGGYYDGKTVVKAEENLLVNSVWAGAVSGTPGTAPSNWSYLFNGGAITVSGESIEFFASAGNRHAIVRTIDVLAGQEIRLSIDVDSITGTSTAAAVYLEPLGGTVLASNVRVLVSGGTGRKTASATVTTGGQLRVRIGASVEFASADDFTVSLKRPQLEIRSAVTAYTPTTTAPITRYIPQLLFAPAGVPVIHIDPLTGRRGLRVEPAATNLLQRSQEFDDAYWTKSNAGTGIAPVVTANDAIAPDGTLTADRIDFDRGAGNTVGDESSLSRGSITIANATAHSGSVFIKAATPADVGKQIGFRHVGLGTYLVITLTANYQRVARVETSTSTSGSYQITSRGTVTTSNQVSVHLWGAQLEVGSAATSYIPTVASQVTRLADSAVMTGGNFSSWYRADRGIIYAELSTPILSVDNGLVISDGTANNRLRIGTSLTEQGTVTTGGTAQAALDGGTPVVNQAMRVAMTYAVDDFRLSLNGGAVVSDTSGTLPVVDRLSLGANVTIYKMAFYPALGSSASLQALTR